MGCKDNDVEIANPSHITLIILTSSNISNYYYIENQIFLIYEAMHALCFVSPVNLVFQVATAGATMVSRWTVMHPLQLKQSIKRGLTKKGFSFIEVISPCTTGYGRNNNMSPIDMMKTLRKVGKIKKVHPTEAICDPEKEIILGDFVDFEKPTYNDAYEKVMQRAGQRNED